MSLKTSALFAVVALLAASAAHAATVWDGAGPAPASGPTVLPAAPFLGPFAGDWDGTEPVQTGRILRDGVASNPPPDKAFPGQFDGSAQLYEEFTFRNDSGVLDEITVAATVSSTDTHFSAFLSPYDPIFLNNAATYLGDIGSSLSQPFSFNVPAGAEFSVVASTNFGAAGATGQTFSFEIRGTNISQVGAVPEPASATLGLLGLAALGLRRRRRAA